MAHTTGSVLPSDERGSNRSMPSFSLTWNNMSQNDPTSVMLRSNSSNEEPPIGQTLRIIVGVESGVLKRLQQFRRREEAELVNLTGAPGARSVRDLVIKKQAGDPPLNFPTTHPTAPDSTPLPHRP